MSAESVAVKLQRLSKLCCHYCRHNSECKTYDETKKCEVYRLVNEILGMV